MKYNPLYLRKRPFLVIEAILRPADHVRTERRGWATEPNNWSVFERPYAVDSVGRKTLSRATIIIDLHQRKLVKNRFVGNASEEVLNHYMTKYADQAAEAINIWLARTGQTQAAVAA